MPPRIDFLIIGAQKSGTTSLYRILGQHPGVHLPETKEIHYFARDELYAEGDEYLSRFYSDMQAGKLTGLAYVHNMYFPSTYERIYDHNPGARLVAVLREPAQRAYSAYWFARRNGWENLESFEEALRVEDRRREGSFKERAELTYLEHGHYAEQLRPYIDAFGRGKLFVILTDELRSRPEAVVADLLEWMGLDPSVGSLDTGLQANVAGSPRFHALQKYLRSHSLRSAAQRVLPDAFRHFVRLRIIKPLLRLNVREERYPPMRPETRRRLEGYFAPHNSMLRELLDRPIPDWS